MKRSRGPIDVRIQYHGSLYLFIPQSNVAQAWLDENVSEDAQYVGNGLVVEPRYVGAILEGLRADGLVAQ